MDLFLYTIFTYPVVIYSVLFIVVLIYWLVCALGFIDFDSSGADAGAELSPSDVDVDMDADVDLDADGLEPGAGMGLFSGLLFKFGLYGIPLTIIFSLLIIFGWFVCSVTIQLLPVSLSTGLTGIGVGTGVLLASLFVSAWLTGRLVSPIRRFLDRRKEDTSARSLCGRAAVVRSGSVTPATGQVQLVKDGSTFILNAQSIPGDAELRNGDTVYILEYNQSANTYTVVSEAKFKGI